MLKQLLSTCSYCMRNHVFTYYNMVSQYITLKRWSLCVHVIFKKDIFVLPQNSFFLSLYQLCAFIILFMNFDLILHKLLHVSSVNWRQLLHSRLNKNSNQSVVLLVFWSNWPTKIVRHLVIECSRILEYALSLENILPSFYRFEYLGCAVSRKQIILVVIGKWRTSGSMPLPKIKQQGISWCNLNFCVLLVPHQWYCEVKKQSRWWAALCLPL